jgi:hypothetical protein
MRRMLHTSNEDLAPLVVDRVGKSGGGQIEPRVKYEPDYASAKTA